jgi:hypothetical protein
MATQAETEKRNQISASHTLRLLALWPPPPRHHWLKCPHPSSVEQGVWKERKIYALCISSREERV